MQNTVEGASEVGCDEVFPTPLPLDPWPKFEGAVAHMIFGLNHLGSGVGAGPAPRRTPGRLGEDLGFLCERFDVWDREFEPFNFRDFFAKRGVTYDGEKVRMAQTLNWTAVSCSLPDEVGQLGVRDFCTHGTRHYIDHFEEFLIDPVSRHRARAPKVMEGDDWPAICQGLIAKNICAVKPIEELYHVDQEPLLNGMFGVGKGEFIDGVETQRLIMNLITLNNLCEPLVGGLATLPNISSFGAYVMGEGELALVQKILSVSFTYSVFPRSGNGFWASIGWFRLTSSPADMGW